MNFFLSNRRIFLWLLAGILALAAGLYFRLYPLYHNVSADAYEQATMIVLGRIRSAVDAQINTQFPGMPQDQKKNLAQTRFNEILRRDNAKIRQAFNDVGLNILKQSGEQKHYLLESDSFYFLNLTENIIDKGDVSTRVTGNRYFNELMVAPLGQWEPQLWHPHLGAWVYHAVKFFKPAADTMFAVAFTPLVLLPFAVAGFLFACRAMGCSPFPAMIATVFFVLAEIFLKRSTYAWYDDDIYNGIFPVAALGFLFMAQRSQNHTKHFIVYVLLAGATIALYSRFWPGWIFLPAVILLGISVLFIETLFNKHRETKSLLFLGGMLILGSAASLFLFYSPAQVVDMFTHAAGELEKFTRPKFDGWPDIFIVVGELKKGTWNDIITMSGGLIMCIGAMLSLIFFSITAWLSRMPLPKHITILAVYLAVTCYLAFGAQRFTILCFIPMSLLFACGLNALWHYRDRLRLHFPITLSLRIFSTFLGLILISLLAFPLLNSQRTIRSLLNPIYNSAWDRVLTKIRDHTPPNAIINTWWSPGHFVKAIAKRRVTFDGASIRGDIAYWLNRVYLSSSEEEALGYLRMLNTSSNEASTYLANLGWPLSKAVPLIAGVTRLPRPEAQSILNKALSPEHARKVLTFTHGEPGKLPPSYLLIYNEIVDGNVMLGYLGKWDFSKVERLNATPELAKKIPGKGSPGFIDFIWSLAGGPYRQSEPLNLSGKNEDTLIFEQGVMINSREMTAAVNSKKFGTGIPASIIYDNGSGSVIEKKLPGASLSYSVVFFKAGNSYQAALMDHALAASLIVKLYYFDGKGLQYFKPFSKESDLTGRTKIFVYEIRWPNGF